MSEPTNIRGEFNIELAGQMRTIKVNFDAIERLEGGLFSKPIVEKLYEAAQGRVAFRDVVTLIDVGLQAAKDTRLSRNQIGEAVLGAGMANYIKTYIDYLTYCINGGQEAKAGAAGEG